MYVTALIVAALVVGSAIVVFAMFFSRSRSLAGRVGSFQCSMRYGGGWRAGIAQYGVDRLDWFRLFSLDPRPAVQWRRGSLAVVAWETARDASGRTDPRLLVVACQVGPDQVELIMSREAYAGLASWLEAAPPREAPVGF